MKVAVARTPSQNFLLILTLGILNALTPFTIDMYLPSFPEIARDMNVAVAQMALTVSIYFIGFALGQIFYGPLLDRFGRKQPLYFGLSLYVISSIGCMFSKSIESLLFFRFLSALGGCAANVGATAMVRDFFPPEAASKVFSLLMLVLSVSPLLAPTFGGMVILFAGWTTIFGILAVMGILNILLVAYVLPPAAGPDHSVELHWRPVLRNFRNILRNQQFSTYAFSNALSFTGLFVYVAGSPAIFMDGFKVSAQVYGAIFAALAAGMIGGGQLNILLTRKFKPASIFRAALTVQVIFAAAFFATTLLGVCGLYGTIAFIFLILLCAGITSPNGASLALAPFTKNVGSASALLGFVQLGTGAVASAVVGMLPIKGALPTAATMSISTALGLIILTAARRRL